MSKGRTVPGNADSKTKVVFAAFVARDENGQLTLFYSGDVKQQAFSWDTSQVRSPTFSMHAAIDIQSPRFLYVKNEQHIPIIGWPDGIYLPSGRFVALGQDARREATLGGVHLDDDAVRKL